MSKKLSYLRPENLSQYQNRKGPGGCDLDPTEAIAWFPELEVAPIDRPMPIIKAGDSVLVGFGHLRFWLHDVEISVEAGFYFGNIVDYLPENRADLNANQNIGFEVRHVFDVRSPDVRKAAGGAA